MNNEEYLWNMFVGDLGEIGAAAVIGNLKAESALLPRNLQNSYEKKLGYNDDSYTNAVDSGRMTGDKFAHDCAGYGLAQWTHWSRKASLYQWTVAMGYSVGDLTRQGLFVLHELEGYGLVKTLKNCTDLYEATSIVLRKYERPADQSDANCQRRTKIAKEIYDKHAAPVNDAPLSDIVTLIDKIDKEGQFIQQLAKELREKIK